jgi:hypothetical protein
VSYPALTTTAPVLLRRLLALPFAALAVAALLACTSSGDGGMDLTDDFLDSGAHFEADASLRAPGDPNPRVEISMSEGDRTSFCLDVDAFRVANLYSVSFTLAFDGSQAELTSYAVGDLLGSDLLVSVDGSSDGQVIVGLTRQFPVHGMTGVSTSGGDPGHLIELCFNIDGEGVERPVGFLPNLALEDFDGNSVGPTEWLGGLLTTAL